MSELEYALADLVSAYHILHHHGIFQEYGSISFRNPENPKSFFVSCLPAILVSSREHLYKYNIADCERVEAGENRTAPLWDLGAPTAEPYVHSSIYDRFPGVKSVVHSQAKNGIVYSLCDAGGSMMMPVYNKAGFVGNYNPIFNPAKHYDKLPPGHPRDLRVSHKLLGDSMAALLSGSTRTSHLGSAAIQEFPDFSCVLLRGNGIALWNDSIQGAVHKAIHLQRSTYIQTAAMLQRAHSDLELTYLTDKEAVDSEASTSEALRVMWAAWMAEVQGQPRYRNDISLERRLIG
jgi:ribulose-5-phosphate 4-epimerase/fuculose-1-phosphate aldolase